MPPQCPPATGSKPGAAHWRWVRRSARGIGRRRLDVRRQDQPVRLLGEVAGAGAELVAQHLVGVGPRRAERVEQQPGRLLAVGVGDVLDRPPGQPVVGLGVLVVERLVVGQVGDARLGGGQGGVGEAALLGRAAAGPRPTRRAPRRATPAPGRRGCRPRRG